MKTHTKAQIINGADGQPAFAVIPYDMYLKEVDDDFMPHEVVGIMVQKQCSITRAWREYLGITQEEMAKRLFISQPAYQKLENSENMKMVTRKKIAIALGIRVTQLAAYDDDDE